jgi:hypothetical protein
MISSGRLHSPGPRGAIVPRQIPIDGRGMSPLWTRRLQGGGFTTLIQKNIRDLNFGAMFATVFLEAFYYFRIHFWKWPNFNWFIGSDQAHYLAAARAWSVGDLDPTAHYYLPGYALLAAGFARILPPQPFMLVDFACIIATFGLFVAICRRLAPDSPYATLLACLAFLIATLSVQPALLAWVVPWTTTPAAPLTLWTLLAALHFATHPSPWPAFLGALAAALIAWFRPADCAVVLGCLGMFMLWVVLNRRVALREATKYAVVAMSAVVLAVAPLVAVHHWIFGSAIDPYLTRSANTGFEWRLIPIRWVTIVLDPRPLFPDVPGLISVFPWIVPGIAGLLFSLLRKPREAHALVGGAVAVSWLLYLSYRDLQVPALWADGNYHYFTWMLPFLAFYALLWVRGLMRRSGRAAAILSAGTVIAVLLPWRAGLDIYQSSPTTIERGSDGRAILTLPAGLARTDDAVLLSTGRAWDFYSGGDFDLEIAGHRYGDVMALGYYSRSPGLMILPVRPLPPGPATVIIDRQLALGQQETLSLAHQHISYALPCLLARWTQACLPQ